MSRWYIIHAYSGFENKVRDSIISEAERMGLSEGVEQVEVPSETITEVKAGKKRTRKKKLYPGYVLLEVEEDKGKVPRDVWFLEDGRTFFGGFTSDPAEALWIVNLDGGGSSTLEGAAFARRTPIANISGVDFLGLSREGLWAKSDADGS